MFNIIICMFSNLFRISIIRRFMYVFIEKVKVRKPIEIVAYSLFFLINTGLYLGFHNPIINFMCNLIGIMLITFMYTNQWYENLFLTVTIYILNMICDIVVTFIFVDYKIGEYSCAVKPHVRSDGNRQSGTRKPLSASLLA